MLRLLRYLQHFTHLSSASTPFLSFQTTNLVVQEGMDANIPCAVCVHLTCHSDSHKPKRCIPRAGNGDKDRNTWVKYILHQKRSLTSTSSTHIPEKVHRAFLFLSVYDRICASELSLTSQRVMFVCGLIYLGKLPKHLFTAAA